MLGAKGRVRISHRGYYRLSHDIKTLAAERGWKLSYGQEVPMATAAHSLNFPREFRLDVLSARSDDILFPLSHYSSILVVYLISLFTQNSNHCPDT